MESLDTYTLIIWEEVPEDTKLFLIPNKDISYEHFVFMKMAHGKLINSDEMNDGLKFLNVALADPEYCYDEDMKKYAGIFCAYQVDKSHPVLQNTNISKVYFSGFIL